jgi:hypothetical protein
MQIRISKQIARQSFANISTNKKYKYRFRKLISIIRSILYRILFFNRGHYLEEAH